MIRPDIYKNFIRWKKWRDWKAGTEPVMQKLSDLHFGPKLYEILPEPLVIRLRLVYHILVEQMNSPFEEFLEDFKYDMDLLDEIQVWEKIALSYLETNQKSNLSPVQRRDLFESLLRHSLGIDLFALESDQNKSD